MRLRIGQIGTNLAVIAMAGVMAIPSASAATEQMGAAQAPEVSGELELANDNCRKQQEKFEGEVVATGKTCLWIYTYDPTAETDEARNYGVVWLQSNVNAKRRWCASKVLSDVDLPNDIRVESRAPLRLDVNRRKTYKTVLRPTADGNAAQTAEDTKITQTQVLYPQSVRTRVVDKGNLFRLKWEGSRDEKLGFASGAEISWVDDPNDDPGGISFALNYDLKRGNCWRRS